MKVHANAPLGPKGSADDGAGALSSEEWSLAKAAAAAGVSDRTCRKWVDRYLAEGEAGLSDRSSAPQSIPHRTADERVESSRAAAAADDGRGDRELPGDGALDGLGGAGAIGLGKLSRLEPPEPPNRYERRHAASLSTSTSKSSCGSRRRGRPPRQRQPERQRRRAPRPASGPKGWEFVHVCVDDATRLAYAEVLSTRRPPPRSRFLRRALAFYARHGITVERVMTDG